MTSPLIAALAAMVESAAAVRQIIRDFMPYPEVEEDVYEGHPEEYAA